jgi:two-component system chemotaxis response regulator CheB
MPPNFTAQLANRLNGLCQVRVTEAADGESVAAGTVYIAPGGKHMRLVREAGAGDYRIRLSMEEPRNGHRPSVDVLFESLAPLKELKRHAVLLTGMGSDGARGMKLLKESGAATTIAEAEETCVVYGMPRAAREFGAADRVEPLQKIAETLTKLVR